MSKVFIADHQRAVRKQVTKIVKTIGHEIQEIHGGREAIEVASQERVDLLLLDGELPGMDGYQVLARLKEAPRTASIPIIMLTSDFSVQSEARALQLGADYVLPIRFNADILASTIRMAIRNGPQASTAVAGDAMPSGGYQDEPAPGSLQYDGWEEDLGFGEPPETINTAGRLRALEDLLNGGIPPGSLTIIEGGSGTGKSVICEYFTYGAMAANFDASYFASNYTTESLIERMNSIGLAVSGIPGRGNLRVYSEHLSSTKGDPGVILYQIASTIDSIPSGLIVIDGISHLAAIADSRQVLGFFMSCQRMSKDGKTIVLTAQSGLIDNSLLPRLNQLCNTALKLTNHSIRGILTRKLMVTRIDNADNRNSKGFSFRVEPDIGIKAQMILGI